MPMRSFGQLAENLMEQPATFGRGYLVTVDGKAGAGKSTFAKALAAELPDARIISMDDLYDGWDGLDEELFYRLDAWVLRPLSLRLPAHHLVYDWEAGQYDDWRIVQRGYIVIIEGVGAGHPITRDLANLRVWIDVDEQVGIERALERDGQAIAPQLEGWTRSQNEYITEYQPREAADLRINGEADVAPGLVELSE